MKKTNQNGKQLQFNKSTVRVLSPRQVRDVLGGYIPHSSSEPSSCDATSDLKCSA